MKIEDISFFQRPAFVVGAELIGKIICHKQNDGTILKGQITELEIYYGEEDSACHARFGKTKRTETLYQSGGITYVYLCYGIHSLLNIVTGKKDFPEAILIRGIKNHIGPGRVSKYLQIDRNQNKIDVTGSVIWIESDGKTYDYITDKRVGIDYASEPYRSIKWRYILK